MGRRTSFTACGRYRLGGADAPWACVALAALAAIAACSSSLGSGSGREPPGSGEGGPCTTSADCASDEVCIRDRCVHESTDADGDGIAAWADCDDQDENVGSVAVLPCTGACGAGMAHCEDGVVGACRCMGDAGGEPDVGGEPDAGGQPDAGGGDVGGADGGDEADASDPGGGGEVCTPDTSETCDDGVDNDCDGMLDCADPDCTNSACGPGGFACEAGGECCGERDVSLSGSVTASCDPFPCGINQVWAEGGDRIMVATTNDGSGEVRLHGFTASGSATADCSGSSCSFQSVHADGNRLIFSPSTGDGTITLSGATLTGSFSPSCGINIPCIIGAGVSEDTLTFYASDGSSGSFTLRGVTECL